MSRDFIDNLPVHSRYPAGISEYERIRVATEFDRLVEDVLRSHPDETGCHDYDGVRYCDLPNVTSKYGGFLSVHLNKLVKDGRMMRAQEGLDLSEQEIEWIVIDHMGADNTFIDRVKYGLAADGVVRRWRRGEAGKIDMVFGSALTPESETSAGDEGILARTAALLGSLSLYERAMTPVEAASTMPSFQNQPVTWHEMEQLKELLLGGGEERPN